MKTTYPPSYHHHNGFVATHALPPIIHGYSNEPNKIVTHEPKDPTKPLHR